MTQKYSSHVHAICFPEEVLCGGEFTGPRLEGFQFWWPSGSFVEEFVPDADFSTSDWFPSEGRAS